MSRFAQALEEGYAKKIPPDIIKAKSFIKSSQEAIISAKKLPIEESTSKSILRELYEGLRQYTEAIGYIKGYKFRSHEAITYFLDDILHKTALALKFDRYRKLRNGINYYGDEISLETIKKTLEEIPIIIEKLSACLKQ